MKNFFKVFFFTIMFVALPLVAEEVETVHYAYANYLGSGIYRTTDQNASLLSFSTDYELGKKNKTSFGLRLPVSFGFFDFDVSGIPELALPSEVGTLTFTPGLSFNYQHTQKLSLETYADVGYARNFTTNKGVNIQSFGISALYKFEIKKFDSIWANRVYYAGYDGNGYEAHDSYAALQIGVDTGFPVKYNIYGIAFQPRIFATAFWYFSEVDFFIPTTKAALEPSKVTLTNSVEFGVTMKFDKKIGFSWGGIERLGLSYRFSENFSAIRLLFSFPI